MLIVDRLLVGGIKFVLGKIAAAAEAELDNDEAVREELLALQMKLELGEIDEAEYAEVEKVLLERLRDIQARRRGDADRAAAGGKVTVEGIEILDDEQ